MLASKGVAISPCAACVCTHRCGASGLREGEETGLWWSAGVKRCGYLDFDCSVASGGNISTEFLIVPLACLASAHTAVGPLDWTERR